MAIKPILFNTDMVQAILNGRKTVTRRLVKHDVDAILNSPYHKEHPEVEDKQIISKLCMTPYQPGDILYVRETWGICNLNDDENIAYIVYKASENEEDEGYREVRLPNDKFEKMYDSMAENSPDWRPSIHMPKEAARIWLKVKNVRVERLKDMTDKDALKEGAQGVKCDHAGLGAYGCTDCMNTGWLEPPILEFMGIWNSTIKKSDIDRYGWDASPWVWVIEFERCEKPE